jgi:metallophosphoesterase superfamily enzyme
VFWQQGARGVVLPAFGAFTGCYDVTTAAGDQLFAAGEREVVDLPIPPME